jgi:hypothetical protein
MAAFDLSPIKTILAPAVCTIGLAACAVHPAADVSQALQSKVVPGAQEMPVPSMAIAPAARGQKLSPLLQPAQLDARQSPGDNADHLTVIGERSLGGVWRVYLPHAIGFGLPAGWTYGRVGMHLCRLVQHGDEVAGRCLLDKAVPIAGAIQGERFRLFVDNTPMNGRVIGWDRMQGSFSPRVLGIGLTPALPMAAERRVGASQAQPPAGSESALRIALADAGSGNLPPAHFSAAAIAALHEKLPALRDELNSLGALDALTFVETQDVLGSKAETVGTMAVYAADFARGGRLCAVGLAASGQIQTFMCG